MQQKVLLAIPTFRCEKQIVRTLEEIDKKLAARVEEIAVIDNGSPDQTVQAALDYKKNGRLKNLRIYQNVENYNLGVCCHEFSCNSTPFEWFCHELEPRSPPVAESQVSWLQRPVSQRGH